MSLPEGPPGHAPRVRLLGPPALLAPGGERPFAVERPFLLLAYLACRRDWVRRDELADLLYPGRELESARSNLRKVLFLARKVEGVGPLDQHGDLLRWAPQSDAAAFDAACDQRRWADALAAYGGPLLMGLEAACPPERADWLDGERQRLQARWHEACARRLAELEGEPEAAAALAQQMLRHDPLDDLALLALGRAQKALGRAGEALQTLADFRERLARQGGVAASAALDALGTELRTSAPPPPPAPAAGLVGRRHERRQVLERMADPECRLCTLLGPPGVGKSTLARALAADLGATWVALEDLAHADRVPERIAGLLGLALDGALAGWPALAQALAARADVLLLDNAEHLALAEGLQRLLAAAPRLRVLATSRAPLGVAGEWRLPVEGLPLPDRDETDPEVLAANDAVRLFVQRARPLAPAFDLAAEAADVVRLVHEVEGLPLAIELLAAWRRLMPVSEILLELAQSLDVLEPYTPNERSVRASFARSWQQLGTVEQRVLSQLALLPAPIDRELLRAVLQAPLPVLAALADRSLLRADGDGRFSLHPLIRRLAAPMAPDADALRDRHARHVAARLGPEARPGADDLAHLRAAWHWALAREDLALVLVLRRPYAAALQRRALWREGTEALGAAVALHRRLQPGQPTLAALLASLASFCYQAGLLDEALQAATEAERHALAADDPAVAALAASRCGSAHWQRGEHAAARAAFMRQLAQAERLPQADAERARAQAWIALVDKAEGRYEAALQGYRQAVQLLRAEGNLPRHLYLMNNLGNLLRMLGRPAEALEVMHEGLQLARVHGSLEDEPFLLTNIGRVHEDQGELAAAAEWAERAVASAGAHGEPMIELSARLLRACCTAALQQQAAPALPDVWTALTIAGQVGSPVLRVNALAGAGFVLALGGQRPAGFALVRHAQAQPGCSAADRDDAERRLQALAPHADELAEAAALLPPGAAPEAALDLLRRAAGPRTA